MSNFDLSRRDFLKLASAGSLAFALSELRLDRVLAAPAAIRQGRIKGVPETYIIDTKGVIRHVKIGPFLSVGEIRTLIDPLLP